MKKITIGTLAYSLMASGAIMGLVVCFEKYKDAKRSRDFWVKEYKKEMEQRIDWQYLARDWIDAEKTMNDRLEEYWKLNNYWLKADNQSD